MPALMRPAMASGDWVAGPSVQTILVRRSWTMENAPPCRNWGPARTSGSWAGHASAKPGLDRLGVDAVGSDGIGHLLRLGQVGIHEPFQDRHHDMGGVGPEVPPERGARVRTPVAIGAEDGEMPGYPTRHLVGHHLHEVADRQQWPLAGEELLGDVGHPSRLGRVQTVPAFGRLRVLPERLV